MIGQSGKLIRTAAPKAPRLHRTDNEFLPAALEILETPLSPIRFTLILSLCAFTTIAIVWAYVGRIDIIAVAQGKLQPVGRSKIVEPLEPGKVHALYVENGKLVKAGDALIALDDSDARADVSMLQASLQALEAEALRRTAALKTALNGSPTQVPQIAWPPGIPTDVAKREERVLGGDLRQLSSALASLDAQKGEKIAQRKRLAGTIAAQEDLVATLKERVDMRSTLLAQSAGSKATVIDAKETLQYHSATLAGERGQLGETDASLRSAQAEIDKTYGAFIATNSEKLGAAERDGDEIRQKLLKAKLKIAHMVLTSPIDGIVQGLSLTTIGQVVTTGEQVMQIVPENASIEIESYLPNGDIGFVKTGQAAIVKVESFPFTSYGTLDAHVVRVGFDAIPSADAGRKEENPTLAERGNSFGGTQRVQNLVYPVTLTLDHATMDVDGAKIPLVPGMAVTVEIKTGRRRILDFLFSPLIQVQSTAMKER